LLVKRNQGGTKPTKCDIDRTDSTSQCGRGLRTLLADVFTQYLKTKSYHWHMAGPHFRDYHLLLDEQANQLFAMSDVIAERTRKLAEPTVHSVGEIVRLQGLSELWCSSVARCSRVEPWRIRPGFMVRRSLRVFRSQRSTTTWTGSRLSGQVTLGSTVANRAYRESTPPENRQPKRSFTGSSKFCLQPR
jgi:hypothetical protein